MITMAGYVNGESLTTKEPGYEVPNEFLRKDAQKEDENSSLDQREYVSLIGESDMNDTQIPELPSRNGMNNARSNFEFFNQVAYDEVSREKRRKCFNRLISGKMKILIVIVLILTLNAYFLWHILNVNSEMDRLRLYIENHSCTNNDKSNFNLHKELQQLKTEFKEKGDTMIAALENINDTIDNGLIDIQILQNKTRFLSRSTLNGLFIWKIKNFSELLREAKRGGQVKYLSDPFYTSQFGYNMCLCIFPNGKDESKGSHLSVYFVIQKGEMDDILQWPFTGRVTITLLCQAKGNESKHSTQSFILLPDNIFFPKPSETKTAFLYGWHNFVSHYKLGEDTYLKNDELYIKAVVDLL